METSSTLTAHRLVHLDLKGAPLRIGYYEQLFPLLRMSGATGLLIEYEDMFPFEGSLKVLAPDPYSLEDVQQILKFAALNELIVIPLVQTFGHMEFILKHANLCHLREVGLYPNSICPSKDQSRLLIREMIRQVMLAHPDAKWIHIGADEVWQLGQCGDCTEKMSQNSLTKEALYLHHVIDISRAIRNDYPGVVPIIWDDMFRFTDVNLLIESQIGNWVEPMVWNYTTSADQFPIGFWDKLSTVFSSVWIASAFKGATGTDQTLPIINYHLDNHMLWLGLLPTIQSKFKHLQGWCLTGWQRYDHYAVLCELLPSGIPSLILCLQAINYGTFNETVNLSASNMLGLQKALDPNALSRGEVGEEIKFPGSEIFAAMKTLLDLKRMCQEFLNGSTYKGWFSKYHMKYNISNPLHTGPMIQQVALLKGYLLEFRNRVEVMLDNFYFPKTTEEWLIENIDPELHNITSVHEQLTHFGLIKS